MLRGTEERNRRMLRARDAMDRTFAQPLDIPALARVAHSSPAHFSRQFREVFGETPHRYLQRRRVERAMELLRETDRPVTEICFDVGWGSLGTFSRTFSEIVGESPSSYRARFADGGDARGYPPAGRWRGCALPADSIAWARPVDWCPAGDAACLLIRSRARARRAGEHVWRSAPSPGALAFCSCSTE